MRHQMLGITAAASLAVVSGCSSSSSTVIPRGSGGSTGAASGGTIGTSSGGRTGAGTGATIGAASGGTTVVGTGGTTGGATGGTTAAGTAGASGAATGGRTGTAGASGLLGDITTVVPTMGCGMDPGQALNTAVRYTIQTMGSKPANCADSNCAPWMYAREYFVTLPTGYDRTKAYPLVLEGPGCGAVGTAVYPLTFNGVPNANNAVIRIGLTPPPNTIGHATNPGEGCFDDKEGDSSVDWVFYETLYDYLSGKLCFDRNRVFTVGNSSGAWFSNELGCKYAGDPSRPVRAIMPNTGGLPTDARYVPTCTTKPIAGMWIHEINDTTNPFTGNKVAIARAMRVNGCTIGTGYDDAQFANFPIGGGNPDTTCKKIMGCPDLYPLVVCALPGNAHGSHDNVANPGFSTFITLFGNPPLLTP